MFFAFKCKEYNLNEIVLQLILFLNGLLKPQVSAVLKFIHMQEVEISIFLLLLYL